MSRLGLFLSGRGSLSAWQRSGLLSRELRLYLAYLEAGIFDRVIIFSYDAADRELLDALAKRDPAVRRIDLIAPGAGRGGAVWSFAGVLRHRKQLAACTVLKTNQASGAWAALLASWLTARPLVFRLGYVLSYRLAFSGERAKRVLAHLIEAAVARRARAIVVSGDAVAKRFSGRPLLAAKLHVLPSFVDTERFAAKQDYDFDAPMIFVGRLHPNKNVPALLEACAAEKVALTLVGQGPERESLEAHARACGASVRFIGQVDNADLPALLREHTLFILPSLIEGLPKVLIEAMACGMVCIGSDIPGTAELIEDGRTGYLIGGFSAADIAAQIRRARGERDPALGRNARALITHRFGLDRYIRDEAAVLLAAAGQ